MPIRTFGFSSASNRIRSGSDWLKPTEKIRAPVSSRPRLKARKPVQSAPARSTLATRSPGPIPQTWKPSPVTRAAASNSSPLQATCRGRPLVPPDSKR